MHKYTLPQVLAGNIETFEGDEAIRYQLSGVQIPMLQRDYAHGRAEESTVRRRFLDAIFNALNGKTPLELDFVYGSIERLDNKDYFIPLDGQQRLTTLFLLHWYIGNRELTGDSLTGLSELLDRFTYSTRRSAREFCSQLCRTSLDGNHRPSQQIKDATWYFQIYAQDPTVASMLVVMDAIHERYLKSRDNLYEALSQIGFYVLPLRSFHLTDELYIKMNARGKQLTDFENFKADIVKWMQDPENIWSSEFSQNVEYQTHSVTYHHSISLKLDNEWMRLFWHYAKQVNARTGNSIDRHYMQFINRYLVNGLAPTIQLGADNIVKDRFFQRYYNYEGSLKYDGFEAYETLFAQSDKIRSIEIVLDFLCQHHAEINDLLSPSWEPANIWSLFDSNITQQQRIIWFAITRFLEETSYSSVKLRRWLRVVWNLAIDPDVRSVPAMLRIMSLVNRLSKGAGDIYAFLVCEDGQAIINAESSFRKSQLVEEQIKADLILSDPEWENAIVAAESNPLFTGNINFLVGDKPEMNVFLHRSQIAQRMFSKAGARDAFATDYILIRTVIAKIPEWHILAGLNLKDHPDNWQLLLRRSSSAQQTVRSLCDSRTVEEAVQNMRETIVFPSSIVIRPSVTIPVVKARHVHEQLYQLSSFQHWLQTRNERKPIELKWYDDHVYVHRPASWYDRVMLDTYRNELITRMIKSFGFATANRCGTSDHYWENFIYLGKTLGIHIIRAYFDRFQGLTIGMLSSESGSLNGAELVQSAKFEGWNYCKRYNYNILKSHQEVEQLLSTIQSELFDKQNEHSLIAQLRSIG